MTIVDRIVKFLLKATAATNLPLQPSLYLHLDGDVVPSGAPHGGCSAPLRRQHCDGGRVRMWLAWCFSFCRVQDLTIRLFCNRHQERSGGFGSPRCVTVIRFLTKRECLHEARTTVAAAAAAACWSEAQEAGMWPSAQEWGSAIKLRFMN